MKTSIPKFLFTPIGGEEEGIKRLNEGKNPLGDERAKRDDFYTYWSFEGYNLQWYWWQLKLGLNKKQVSSNT